MHLYPNKEKKSLLAKIAWDLDLTADQLFQLFNDEIEEIAGFDKKCLYRRLLTTYDWYTLLKLVPEEKIRQMLDDSVINLLFPKDLKEKYLYARSVLSG